MSFEDFWLNVYLFRVVNSLDHPLPNTFFYYFSFLGSGFVLIPVAIFLWFRRRHKFKAFIMAIAVETLIVSLLKVTLNQPRPATLLEDVKLMFPLYYRSFPSGDTAMAFVLAGILSHGEGFRIRLVLYLYALLIGVGRVYLGVHFPIDVLAGAVIGVLSAYLSIRFLTPTSRKGVSTSKRLTEL